MEKKLAIKGHPTHGNEVIELLKMMGGVNSKNVDGKCDFLYYFIDNDNTISCDSNFNNNFVYFTLEKFWEKYPFKVGDEVTAIFQSDKSATNGFYSMATVTIKHMSWSEDRETVVYDFKETEDVLCAEDLLKSNAEFLVNKEKSEEVGKMLCDRTLNHLHRNHLKNVLSELYEHIKTTPKEELEREFEEIEEWSNVGPTVEEFRTFCECVNKKPKYPTTYAECCKILDIREEKNYTQGYKCGLITKFQELFIARNTYWKIAGEEMGLDGPWEPDWCNEDKLKYCIECSYGTIDKTVEIVWNCILSFPTEEMRDAFYENFKDLIKECKELL